MYQYRNLMEDFTIEDSIQDVKGAVIGFYRKGRETMDRTDGWKWRTYSWIWVHLYPIRRYLLAFYRRIWLKLFKPI